MRTIIWIFIGLVCLIPITFIGLAVFNAPSKDQYETTQSYLAVAKQYVNNEDINMGLIKGDSEHTEYVRIFAQYLANELKVSRELAKQKNFLVILVRPPNLAATQSLDVSLEKVDDYDKAMLSMKEERETDIQEIINKMNGLNKEKIKFFDIVRFNESLTTGKAEREKEIQQYIGLSQYIRALLQFCKTRMGSYQLGPNEEIQFSHPEDQAYYEKLTAGIAQYIKFIDDMVTQHNREDRKQLGGLTN